MYRKFVLSLSILLLSLMTFPLMAGNALFDAQIKSFDRNLAQFDKELKVGRYGNARWEKKVLGKKSRLTKAIKKIEKKFPKEDVSFLWEKLAKHSNEFDEKLKIAPLKKKASVNSVKKTSSAQDKLYQSAIKSLDSKFQQFEMLVNQTSNHNKTWVGRVERDKNKLKDAITKLEKNWAKKDASSYWDKLKSLDNTAKSKLVESAKKNSKKPAVNKNLARHANSIKVINTKFDRLDSYMKQDGYGEATWDKNLKSHASSLSKSIKLIERDLPNEAKNYWSQFQNRIKTIKVKNQKAAAKAKELKRQNKQKAESQLVLKNKSKNRALASNSKTNNKISNDDLLNKIKAEQNNYKAQGQIEVWDNSTGTIKRSKGGLGYLSFSSDYTKLNESKAVFTGKDFIYANLHLPNKLSDMLPKEHAKGLQYYRVTIIATVKSDSKYNSDKTQKNGNKLQRVADFKLGYARDNLSIAVVPELGFFESILDRYRSDDKFPNSEAKAKAHQDLLSRNFSRQLSLLFKQLPVGSHQVNIEFQVVAKLRQEKFYELKNMKGTFLLEVDTEAKERYKNTFDMLTKLYKSYSSEYNLTMSTLDLDAEKKKLASMTPLQRECYHIAKRSPVGYMDCYKGPKSAISFHISPIRSKPAFIDITWPKGNCERCMAGTEGSIKIRKNAVKTLQVPNNARVSINGRTLINSVTSKQDVILHWFY